MENYFNCIYCYTNKINGKKYVGQTVNFNTRHQQHCYNSYDNMLIDKAINKYGIDNFEVEILKCNLSTQCLLNFWECYYIDLFDTLAKNGKGYNIASGGFNGYTCAGKTEDEMNEIKNKISDTMKSKGLKRTEEHKRKVSEANKGRNNGMLGVQRTQEIKEKICVGNGGGMIDRYTVDGNYVDTRYRFEFVEMGFQGSQISKCCVWYGCKQDLDEYRKHSKDYPRKTVGRKNDKQRYIFLHHDNDFTDEEVLSMIKNITMDNIGRLIDRFDIDGNYIDTHYQFEFVKMGFDRRKISTLCIWFECGENEVEFFKRRKGGLVKSHKGCTFKYHTDD